MKKRYIIILLILSVFICGCVTWQLVGASSRWRYANFEAMLPEGWMKFGFPPDLLFLTRDGELLQNIRFFRYKIGVDKVLPISKKKFTDEMLLQEITEVIINEMSLDNHKQNLKVLENIPATIGGKDGFRLEYTFNTPDYLKCRAILYGFKQAKFIYLIQYYAAAQHYFNKDLETFNQFIVSFKIL